MTAISPYCINVPGDIAFDIERPTVAMIEPSSIMHQLVMLSRWGGNVQFPYSILQHSLIVAENMANPAECIYGFVHDWPEAFLGADIATPWKRWFHLQGVDVNAIERRFMTLIYQRLDLPEPSPAVADRVHLADQRALATEFRDVVAGKLPYAPSAPPFRKPVLYQNWARVLEQGHAMLDAYLHAAREEA